MRRLVPALLLLAALAAPATAAEDEAVLTRDVTIASFDGTQLGATLYWTEAAETTATPVILTTHGWANDRSQRDPDARWLAGLGYVVLAYDSRGYGDSEGVVGLDGPDEVADVSALVDWLAGLNGTGDPRVLLDAPGDPRLGMTGLSYSGAIQLLAAAHDDRIDAIQPDITWNNLSEALAPAGVVKRGWLDLLFWGGLLTSHGAGTGSPDAQGMDARLRDWYLQAQATGRLPPEAAPALAERSPSTFLDNVTVPVFLTQGWPDTLFDPDEALATYQVLAGREAVGTRILFHPAGHGYETPAAVRERVRAEVAGFLGRHLLDDGSLPGAPVLSHRGGGAWTEGVAWPPGAARPTTVAARTEGILTLAQVPPPTSHTEDQEFQGALGLPNADVPVPTSALIPLDLQAPRGLLGTPVVRLDATPTVDDLTLFLSLVDRGPAGDRVVHRQVTPFRLEGQADRLVPLEIPLVSTEHHLQAGHALLLRVATSDAGYFGGRDAGTVALDLTSMEVVLPLEPPLTVRTPDEDAASPPAAAQTTPGASAGLAVALLIAAVVVARSRHPE